MSAGSLALDLLIGPLPRGEAPPATLEAWARARGLRHEAEGLLAPLTPRLRLGLGAGTHSSLRAPDRDGFLASTGPQRARKRPERQTTDVCRGILPGGLDGVLAHHTHLAHAPASDGPDWTARAATVVVAAPAGAGRAVCVADAGRRHEMKALATFGRATPSSDPLKTVVPQPRSRVEAHGVTWSLQPAEPQETLDALAAAGPALRAAGDVEVEIEFGVLCVWIRGAVTDPARLDALCRAASAVADALHAVAAGQAPLEAGAPAGAREQTARRRWIDAGVATVDWSTPPADIPAAVSAYGAVTRRRARRVSRRIVLWLLAVLIPAMAAGLWVLVQVGYAYGGVVTTAFGLWLAFKIVRGALSVGRDVSQDETDARALPWGIEAFLQGYAGSRRLTVEDPDALRRRFEAPIRGRAVIAAQGRIAPGVDGHLTFWRERVAGAPDRHWAMAIVAAPEAPVVAPAGFQADVRGGLLVVREEVAERGRSAVALDRVAGVAGALA